MPEAVAQNTSAVGGLTAVGRDIRTPRRPIVLTCDVTGMGGAVDRVEEHGEFDLPEFLGAEVWGKLVGAGAGSGRTFRFAHHPGVMKDDGRTKMVTVFVEETGKTDRKVILKLCAPGKRRPGKPGSHRAAENSTPREWVKHHIVSQPETLNAVFFDDGRYLMFMDIAGGDSGNTVLLTHLLDAAEAVQASCVVVDSMLREWNYDAGTENLSVVDMLEKRIKDRLPQDEVLKKYFPGIPQLLDAHAEYLLLPNEERLPHPIAVALGRGRYSTLRIDVPVGKAHGDFHGDNIAFPIRHEKPALEDFLLLDLDAFLSRTALTHDPANLALTAADHWLREEGEVGKRQQEALLQLLLRPESALPRSLPPHLYELITKIHEAGRTWASEQERNWGSEWRRATSASTMAVALLFASRETANPERQLWYVRLAARAAQLLVAPATGATPPPRPQLPAPAPQPAAHRQECHTARSDRDTSTSTTREPASPGNAKTAEDLRTGSRGRRFSPLMLFVSARRKILLGAGGLALVAIIGLLWAADIFRDGEKKTENLQVRVATNPDKMVLAPKVGRLEGSYITKQPIERVPAPPVLRDSCAGRYQWAHDSLDAVDADTTFVWVEITALKSPARVTGAQLNYAKNSLSAPYEGTLLTCGGKGGGNQPPNVLDADLDTGTLTFYPEGGEDPATMNLVIPKGHTAVMIVMARTEEGFHQWNVTLEVAEGDRTQWVTAYPNGARTGDPGRTESHKYFETAGGLTSEPYRFRSGKWLKGR